MAILEQSTNNYYRVDFNKSSIRGLGIYVFFYYYKTSEDRQKEKDRLAPLTKFLEKLREKARTSYEKLLSEIEENGVTESDADSNGTIDKNKFPALYEQQQKVIFYNDFITYLTANFIVATEQAERPKDYNSFLEEIKALGYDTEWLDDPVRLIGGVELYCGDYNGENICHEFYYNQLKERMNDSIIDC